MVATLVLAVAGLMAGALNAVAGGGTFLSFPALVWMGVPPIMADATATLTAMPGCFTHLHGMNGLKNALSALLSVVSAATYAAAGLIAWNSALVLAVATTVGGVVGARYARRIRRTDLLRAGIVAVGAVMTALFFLTADGEGAWPMKRPPTTRGLCTAVRDRTHRGEHRRRVCQPTSYHRRASV